MKKTFGQYFREKRIEKSLTLREFCKKNNYDIGYISRLENDLFLPPEDEEKLKKLAQAIGLREKTTDWQEFTDLVAINRGQLPKDINQNVLNYLPAFFRKASKKKVEEEDVKKLISLIKGNK